MVTITVRVNMVGCGVSASCVFAKLCLLSIWVSGAILSKITDPLLDAQHFTYRANRSVGYAMNMAQHFILQDLCTYTRLLLVVFSSTFNTIIPVLLYKFYQPNVPDIRLTLKNYFMHSLKTPIYGRCLFSGSENYVISPRQRAAGVLLQMLFWEYASVLVWLHCLGRDTPEGHQHSTEHHRLCSPLLRANLKSSLYFPLSPKCFFIGGHMMFFLYYWGVFTLHGKALRTLCCDLVLKT